MMRNPFLILFLAIAYFANAQEHEWVTTLFAPNKIQIPFLPTMAMSLDSNNNSYVLGAFSPDFVIDKDTILHNGGGYLANSFVAKFNPSGDVKWVNTMYLYTNSIDPTSLRLFAYNINTISDNKIIVHGYFQRGGLAAESNVTTILKLSKTDSIINTNSNNQNIIGFYAIYDSIGNVIKCNKLFEGGLSSSNLNGQVAIDDQKNLYILTQINKATSGTFFSNKVDTTVSYQANQTMLLVKFTANFDSIAWCKVLSTHTGVNYYKPSRMSIGLNDNNVYIASFIHTVGSGTITIDSIDYSQFITNNFTKGFLTVLSPLGNFIHKGFINNDVTQQDNIFDIFAVDTGRIYITGYVQDSMLYGGKWFTSSGVSSFDIAYPYIAKLSISKANWIKLTHNKTVTAFSSTFFNSGFNSRIGCDKHGFVYSYFDYQINVLSMGGLTDSSMGKTGFVKLDSLGNALWLRSGVNTIDMKSDMDNSLVYCGNYVDTLSLPPFTLPYSQSQSGFIAKVNDYSITRGEVSAGPYCAGDSMDIPYTRKGKYDPDNWFIAQLSDENGNFDDTSKVRELGRVKSTEDSTIRGELPLFQVASSGNYRIRVISTSPPVQSFYKRDSLRLLIYSRDKADPGPPELACFGDSFQLHTYGGTVWEWSPAYLMGDSTSRTPKVLALQDTVFRIVISDTSGCGEPDTAFKRIIIRNNPKVDITDSFKVCLNEEVALSASFRNGDTLGYKWTWYNIVKNKGWSEIARDSFALLDTLLYKYNNTTATRRLAIVLDDNCSVIKDTAEFVVTLKPIKIKGKISTLDSLQCDGSLVELFGNISGGDSATYSWEWFEVDVSDKFHFLNSGQNKFADTISVQLNKSIFDSRKFAFVTKDECLPYIDSSFIELKIDRRVPKSVVFPRDTAICPSTSAEITAQISDGSGKGFRWKWIDEKGNILSQDSGNVSETKTTIKPIFNSQDSQRFWFIVEDICSPESDTQEFVISPLPPLEISELYYGNTLLTRTNGMLSGVEACFKELLNFTANGKGGTEQKYQWNWKILNPINDVMLNSFQHLPEGNSDSLTDYEPSELLRKLLVTLTLHNGCMEKGDSISFEVKIREPLKAQILNFAQKSANDTSVCSGSELKFFANGTGGVEEDYEFTWLLDDEEISKGDSVEINSKDFKSPDAILTLILQDDCSILADTQRINLHTLPELKAEFSAPDTICLGEEISLAAQGSGGIENQYQFTWLHKKDDGTLEVLKNAETLDLNSKTLISESQYSQFNTREILLVLRDNCSSPNDTFSKKIIIRPELSLTLSSSTICADPNATLTANPKGGNPNSYSIDWFDKNGNSLGNGLTQTAIPEGFDRFSATLSDNCSSENATAEIKVDRVPELLTLENTPSEGCEPLPVDFTLQTNYPDKYGFTLSFGNGDSTHTFEIPPTLHYTYPHAGHFIPLLTLITAGGCQAQVSGQAIEVYPKPFADFGYQPEEPDMDNPLVSFQNRSTGAVSYQWDIAPFGTFTDENPIVTYSDTGYHNVRLIAVSSHGCRDT
ncbi:MAG: hypothetical protein KF882_09630, partial [Bacteroidia bacterium]|nr:hypothetical protein [Bacteroidia bacterium]